MKTPIIAIILVSTLCLFGCMDQAPPPPDMTLAQFIQLSAVKQKSILDTLSLSEQSSIKAAVQNYHDYDLVKSKQNEELKQISGNETLEDIIDYLSVSGDIDVRHMKLSEFKALSMDKGAELLVQYFRTREAKRIIDVATLNPKPYLNRTLGDIANSN